VEEYAGLERLRRLLGGPQLAELRRRLRARYERGEQSEVFTLSGLSAVERRALEGLTGRAVSTAASMRLRAADIDAALARADLAPDLRRALELLDGPILDRVEQRRMLEHAWGAVLGKVEDSRLEALVTAPGGAGLLKRLSAGDPERADSLLEQTQRVLLRLPERGIPRAQLAAQSLGNSHALDAGSPIATLVLRACDSSAKSDGAGDERPREQWARVGVTVNELAAPALCLNLPIHQEDGIGALAPGEPIHLSLRKLLRDSPRWAVVNRDVFVCENANIVAIAADRLAEDCAPLVCTDGMPSAAQQTLLAQLAAAGARLRYHGDFDWPGVTIGNFVMRAFGARPWLFSMENYVAACAAGGSRLPATGRVEAQWDSRLADSMVDRALAIHEEALADLLLLDLEVRSP
jgi:uncharacterized protein (TIGR02679 family)